ADRASQISGLDTVADAIALAALPLPDVWAPLSDSLRLITGYGREVKVGEDVVARMVNFSRSTTATYIGKDGLLKTASANEPRFEKEGLLIEGQSTNLCPNSNGFWLTGGQAIAGTAVDPAGTTKNIYTATKADGTFISVAGAQVSQGVTYTISAWVYCHDSRTIHDRALMAQSNNGIAFAGISQSEVSKLVVGKFVRVSLSFTPPQGVSSVTIVGFVDPPVGAGGSISMCQLEALPFASSYIPTNGAAVTRAADIMTIPCALNWPANVQNERTVAAQVVNMRFTSDYPRMFKYDSGNGGIWYDGTQFASNEINPVGSFYVTKDKISEPHVHAEVHNKDYLQCYMSNVGMGPKGVRGSNPTYKADIQLCTFPYCHIRNVRIWHKVLNDSQIKAIA
ncbi:MAG: phage head spike fiber domain-containing protein, partial [Shewanella sp.]